MASRRTSGNQERAGRDRAPERPTRTRSAGGEKAAGAGISGVRASGLGVLSQFSLATAGTVAASLVAFGTILYSILAAILSAEIDESGVQAVRAMAAVDAGCWRPFHNTALAGHEEDLTLALPAAERPEFERRREQNMHRAASLTEATESKILDAVVLDATLSKVLSGKGSMSFAPTGSVRTVSGVEIKEGLYQSQRARLFTAPILDLNGNVGAYAVIAVSAEKIDERLGTILKSLVLLVILFDGLGLLISWMVAKRITRPIQLLCHDIEVVAKGDLAHRTHPHSKDEIGVLAHRFDEMTQNLLELQEVQKQQAAHEHQIEVAREVQAALLPEKLPAIPGFECAAASRPASKVAGDFYDVFEMAGGARLLAVVSASGTGVPGAMVVTMARSLIKATAGSEASPAELLRKVNRLLAPDLRRGMYVSALLVRLDPASNRLMVANAGHHPLVVCRKGAAKAEPLHSDGIALGFDKGPIFDRTIKEREIELAVGERILLCTRAMFGIRDAEGRELGEEAVYALFARESPKNSEAFVPLTLGALEKFRAGTEASDDITFLTLKRQS